MADLLFDRPWAASTDIVFGDDAALAPYVPSTDLVFRYPAVPSTDLVFELAPEEEGPPPPADVPVSVSGTLPGVAGDIRISLAQPVRVVGTLPAITGAIALVYVSGAARPLVTQSASAWQQGIPIEAGPTARWQQSAPIEVGRTTAWQDGRRMARSVQTRHQDAIHLAHGRAARWQDGIRVGQSAAARWQDTQRLRRDTAARWQAGDGVRRDAGARWQDTLHLRRAADARWQDGVRRSRPAAARFGQGVPRHAQRTERHQEAMKPPAGIWLRPTGPAPFDPCYLPSTDLLFQFGYEPSSDLLFICGRHGAVPPQPGATVVVPTLGVYFVTNQASLRRIDGNIELPVTGMSLALDVDSWTWQFSASVDGSALADLEPANYGEPVELEAMVNGVAYRVLAEGIARERTWGKSGIALSGRGRNAVLDAPYAPVRNFANPQARTAQQLAEDMLTINGVNNGWAIDWQAIDWNVPANVFAHQGTHIGALSAIAAALGGYIQPHRIDPTLAILARYPLAPWDWPAATPDFELPSAVTTREAIQWQDKPLYNRVYVSGVGAGVLGRVTRTGTAGDLLAPMVTDALITAEPVARQRGMTALADVGRQARVDLRLPVLPETGIIVPGKLVRYTDAGTNRIGMVRGVQAEVGFPAIWQTISVETHVNA